MGFVYIHVNDPGLPIWQVLPLTLLGCALGLGLVWCMVALIRLPGERRIRHRVQAVKAAAGGSPPYGVPAVEGAAKRLFMEVHSAWDAGDRQRLARVSDPELMADWVKRLDGYAGKGKRQRASVLDGPRLDYVSLLADRGLVRLRVRAKLRRGFEPTPSPRGAQASGWHQGRARPVLDAVPRRRRLDHLRHPPAAIRRRVLARGDHPAGRRPATDVVTASSAAQFVVQKHAAATVHDDP